MDLEKKNSFYYHLFLFFSSFTRGLIEVFSLVLLYQKGYSVHALYFFLFLFTLIRHFRPQKSLQKKDRIIKNYKIGL